MWRRRPPVVLQSGVSPTEVARCVPPAPSGVALASRLRLRVWRGHPACGMGMTKKK